MRPGKLCIVCEKPLRRQYLVTVEGVDDKHSRRPHSTPVLAVCFEHLEALHRATVDLVSSHARELVAEARRPRAVTGSLW